ncbi:MAG: ketopantoate reductase family protein [Promethearchaeota archaeon]
MIQNKLTIVVYGAGSVGTSVYGWISSHYEKIYLLSRGKSLEKLKSSEKITLYKKNTEEEELSAPVKAIGDLTEIHDIVDVVVITVKNYDLAKVAMDIKSKLKSEPVIVALQNGVENQKILPKYFSKVIYGVVSYNVWRDAPNLIGYTNKGPITIGILNNIGNVQNIMEQIAEIFNLGFLTEISTKIDDVIYNKMVINLANSLNTLAGHNYWEISSVSLLKKILFNLFWEGIQVIKAAGYKEQKMRWMPSWDGLKASAENPDLFSDEAYEKNLKNLGYNSMAQDLFIAKKEQTELEYLNGHILELAESVGVKMPYLKTVYRLAKENFSKSFHPLKVERIWSEIEKEINSED